MGIFLFGTYIKIFLSHFLFLH